MIDGIHHPWSYLSKEEWFNDIHLTRPDLVKRMEAYSEKQGWDQTTHRQQWTKVITSWYFKKEENK